ncbi:RHS repeat domain-containing protein, partial [Treponema denticola]|uniref:RHS repeat domain-containing protein n=1 Tax=Treponema denticola TaxID=158 RepID=UPI003D92E1DB
THKQYGGINPNPDNPHPSNPLHTNKYRQTFAFDIIGNMTNKSSTTNLPGGSIGTTDDTKLNYELDYEYDSKYAHRLIRAGTRYYRYDANGNITAEKDGKFSDKEEMTFTYSYFAEHDVYGVDYGFDLEPLEDDPANLEVGTTNTTPTGGYRRDYTWNERNLLIKSDDKLNTVIYRYGDDGQRALKFTQQSNSETLYFNNFYSVHQVAHEPNHEHGLRVSKHIFVGNSRLVTAMTHADNNGDTTEQTEKRYYYHADHLQSAQFITNAKGEQYEHIEYTPYGELWIEETAPGIDKLPFRFTGKELDEETGLYYYGARYLDPKYSRWLSGDPALNDYIPKAPIDDEAKKHNENLPGMGGVFNVVNLHVYHYAGNNPVKYTDPDGKWFFIDDLLVSIFAKLEGLQDEGIFQGMWMYFKASWMHPIDYGKAFIKFVKFIYEKYKVLKIPINNKLKFFIDWEKKRIGVKTPDIKETEMNIPEFKIFENNDKENMQ